MVRHGQKSLAKNLSTVCLRVIGNAQFDQDDVQHLPYAWCNIHVTPKVLELDWFLPGKKNKSRYRLNLSNCRTYQPKERHLDSVTWQSEGKVFEQQLPPYAIDDTEALHRRVAAFLELCEPWVKEFIKNESMDPISELTYAEVFRWQEIHGSDLLKHALRLQYYSIMCQGWGSLADLEDLGIRRLDFSQCGPNTYEEFQSSGHRPVPQSIDHQIDVAMLQHMRSIERPLLKELKKKINKNQAKYWYEIYLCYYVLLTNLDWIYEGAKNYLESQRRTVSPLPFFRSSNDFVAFGDVSRARREILFWQIIIFNDLVLTKRIENRESGQLRHQKNDSGMGALKGEHVVSFPSYASKL